ncbi:MAG: CoA transferase [Propionibacteriaceae bacterium]|jgi:crotonobetainyl-CoA:carnitine CoA-transferase CaiB-like acyl-CoA transferase|nr:CoA transferase [Propionibacteriaceae bacterium]
MMALEGLKVLDLTRLLPGPVATMYLADFGADVLKVEQPGEGDYSRAYEPLLRGMGYRFLIVNRNKRSLTLDLKPEAGKQVFRELVAQADVVIEGFRPGVMARLGLGYDELSAINPRLIMCSLSGYGQVGPLAQEPGHDLGYTSIAGIVSLTGLQDDAPIIPGVQVADMGGGMQAVIGILLALQARERTGRGQYIDTSLFAAAISMLPADASNLFGSGEVPLRGETRLTGGWPHYNVYQTADRRHVAVAALEPKFWRNLASAIGREDLIPRISDPANWGEIRSALAEVFATRTLADWMTYLDGRDTCVTAVNNLDEALAAPHVVENELVLTQQDERLGTYRTLGQPIKLSDTPGSLRTPAPDLGQHTDEVLTALGYSPERIARLREQGIV